MTESLFAASTEAEAAASWFESLGEPPAETDDDTPICPEHHVLCTWQTGWGHPGWICRLCIEPAGEEE